MGGRSAEQPPLSPESSSVQMPSQSADYQALAQENDRLKEYLGTYEQQIKDLESELKNLK